MILVIFSYFSTAGNNGNQYLFVMKKKNLCKKIELGYCPNNIVRKFLYCKARNCIPAGLERLVAIQILYCRQWVGKIILQYIKLYCSKRGWLERNWVTIQFCIVTWEGQWVISAQKVLF